MSCHIFRLQTVKMIKKREESKSASRNKSDRSPASIWLDGEVLHSDPEYIESEYDVWTDRSDNIMQACAQTSSTPSKAIASIRMPVTNTSLPASPTRTAPARKIRSQRSEMKDIDGFLRSAENAFETNHGRTRCPKCSMVGQFTRELLLVCADYKCRTPMCNKTMGCKELFYGRYHTRVGRVQPFVEDEKDPVHKKAKNWTTQQEWEEALEQAKQLRQARQQQQGKLQ